MSEFYKGCAKTMLICCVLFTAFLFTTAVCDSLEKCLGYYDEGIKESNEARFAQ